MLKKTTFALAFSCIAGGAYATAIDYEEVLAGGTSDTGSVSSAGSNTSADSALSDYWLFHVVAGETYQISVSRLEEDLDPSLWLFEGVFYDTNEFDDPVSLSSSDPAFIDYGDDEISHVGPFGDPLISFTAVSSGFVTAVVANFLSGPDDGGDGYFDYEIFLSDGSPSPAPPNVPLPAGLPLLLGGGALLAALRHRKTT